MPPPSWKETRATCQRQIDMLKSEDTPVIEEALDAWWRRLNVTDKLAVRTFIDIAEHRKKK